VQKALEFAQWFINPAISNPLLLLDNGFLRTVLKASLGPTRWFCNSPNKFRIVYSQLKSWQRSAGHF
jgi:hypothetical protein